MEKTYMIVRRRCTDPNGSRVRTAREFNEPDLIELPSDDTCTETGKVLACGLSERDAERLLFGLVLQCVGRDFLESGGYCMDEDSIEYMDEERKMYGEEGSVRDAEWFKGEGLYSDCMYPLFLSGDHSASVHDMEYEIVEEEAS